jgi:ATP-dependent helicase YprA (DUF1998 family)
MAVEIEKTEGNGTESKRVKMAGMTVPAATASLGIAALRGRQEEAMQVILAGNDVLYVFPTGLGKSVVYQVASLSRTGVTIIIKPSDQSASGTSTQFVGVGNTGD